MDGHISVKLDRKAEVPNKKSTMRDTFFYIIMRKDKKKKLGLS